MGTSCRARRSGWATRRRATTEQTCAGRGETVGIEIPFLNLGRLHDRIRVELDRAIDDVVRSSQFVGGAWTVRFEEAFAVAHGATAAAGCGSGTDALSLALRALGVGPGDEVIVPAMTFVATAEAVLHVGATPVLADVDRSTLLLTAETVGAVRTPRARAVIPVHLYGHVVPFPLLQAWRDDGLLVIEDAAQAHIADWQGKPVGSVGHAACFSFYPGKNLGALGDAGLVLSSDVAVVEEVRRLRDHGQSTKYEHDRIGYCSRLDGLQAAVLLAKLSHLADWTAARRERAADYRTRLGELLVPWDDGAVHHLLVVRVPNGQRGDVVAALADHGMQTGIHYPVALSEQPALAPWSTPCPTAEQAADEVLSLPMDPLMTSAEVNALCDAVLRLMPG